MKFTLKSDTTRINRGGETIYSVNGVFETENKEIIEVAQALGAEFHTYKTLTEIESEKPTKKSKNAKI